MLFAVQTSPRPALYKQKVYVPNQRVTQRVIRRPEVEEVDRAALRDSRTGEYVLLLGVVFVAAIVTLAIIGPQVAHLASVSVGS